MMIYLISAWLFTWLCLLFYFCFFFTFSVCNRSVILDKYYPVNAAASDHDLPQQLQKHLKPPKSGASPTPVIRQPECANSEGGDPIRHLAALLCTPSSRGHRVGKGVKNGSFSIMWIKPYFWHHVDIIHNLFKYQNHLKTNFSCFVCIAAWSKHQKSRRVTHQVAFLMIIFFFAFWTFNWKMEALGGTLTENAQIPIWKQPRLLK